MPDAKKFEHGFNRSTADVILRSSNKVDFKVHKVILAEASSVFESMFALPGNSTSDEDGVTALPVVPMQDTAEVLHALLGVLYPGKGPAITSSPRAGDVLAVADKYAMDGVTKHVKSILERAGFMATWFNILHVYALARRYSFMDLAENAARESLKQPFYPYTLSGLQAMTGADYHELLCYRQACVKLFDDYLPLDYEDYHWEELIENLWGDDYDGLRLQSNKGSDAVLQQLGYMQGGGTNASARNNLSQAPEDLVSR